MKQIQTYHRPETVEEALRLLHRPGTPTALLAGGTALNAHRDPAVAELVDLQAAGLDELQAGPNLLALGAMVRLQQVVDWPVAPPLLRDMAHRAGPNTLRNQGTVGGALVRADWQSEFVAALLLFATQVTVHTPAGTHTLPLPDFLADPPAGLAGGILTGVTLHPAGRTAHARVARTPADTPIVAALGRLDPAGQIHLALCGVAATPILVQPHQVAQLHPPSDFRGSSAYRLAMAQTLTGRVLRELTTNP